MTVQSQFGETLDAYLTLREYLLTGRGRGRPTKDEARFTAAVKRALELLEQSLEADFNHPQEQ